ncbi:SGT1-domain-containing protein [Microthyrium microscopicum]|uniref:SGT1-domain-containing protein n=1 Tax=Microthyrium microscopicum TaxID=703497 RepID=A0A6A6U1L9_9PEZI|nr:SGT1-domain-containing protein [Microthyrium microscopicum]
MEPSVDDGFKWFGEGFDGFPKRLPEDTVEYAIHIIDSTLSQAKVVSRLKEILKEANRLVNDLLDDYIWQREEFKLDLELEISTWSLRGSTNYGDSVADEWLIVYLLRELSLKNPDIWVRVYDTDGEFLLIEAAMMLPKWISPEITQNRVWIHAGGLRIIPLKAAPELETRSPSLKEAISYIERNQQHLVRSPLIEEEAFYRIRNYPKAISEQFHHAAVRIPRKIAHILHHDPTYVSPAIEAFYIRDPIALKPLSTPKPEDLRFPPEDFVDTTVKFTKVGFAQLKGQEFLPPKSWQSCFGDIDSPKALAKAEIGMKLSCGFEMLIRDPQNQNKKAVREMQIILEDIDAGEEVLPTDEEIAQWSQKEDDEKWMDIDFNEFDKELSGKNKGKGPGAGFGDKEAQEQVRKMVSRFDAFLNDDKSGMDGADWDDDDDSDGSEDDEESSDEDEDQAISFDEDEFASAMRQMMGMPPEETTAEAGAVVKGKGRVIAEEDEVNADEIREVSNSMKAELKEAGVLGDEEEDEDAEITIDETLVKNMLEAFKSQGGAAGPAGNLMGLFGVGLPPDKDN